MGAIHDRSGKEGGANNFVYDTLQKMAKDHGRVKSGKDADDMAMYGYGQISVPESQFCVWAPAQNMVDAARLARIFHHVIPH